MKFDELYAELDVMEKTSILFDMSQKSYLDLDEAYKEFKCTNLVYDLYVRQNQAKSDWAKTLWSDLIPQLLFDGIDEFIKEFKLFPKKCRTLPIAVVLETMLKQFRNSIPLLMELKNEAIKESHWEKLMEITGTVRNRFLTTGS